MASIETTTPDIAGLWKKRQSLRAAKGSNHTYRASDRTQEKRLKYWLAPFRAKVPNYCYDTRLYHDHQNYLQQKNYLTTHPYSALRILSCPPPESVGYEPDWFVKMKSIPENAFEFAEASLESKQHNVGDKRLGGGTGNDVPIGRPTISCDYLDVLRKRYTTSKHGIAKSKRTIAAKTVTETHRGSIASSWRPVPICNATASEEVE